MASPIEEKIVKLSLDNNDFLNKAKQSMEGLKGLSDNFKTLSTEDLKNPIQALKHLITGGSQATDSLSQMANATNTIADRFNAMGAVAFTVISRITNAAINMGKTVVKQFTIDPVKSGLQEYEDKLKAIQVILSNTGGKNSLAEITDTLNELNTYADQTIYSFQEMTRNIGTFTAAGVDLKTSQVAIKGIANLAAASGSSSQQASTAMYQLSQAIAAGRVSLMDWNSVVNAQMGGSLFQNELKNTAKEMGIVIKDTKSFRNSLQEGWLTSEVLLNTLQKFSKDQSMIDAATKVKSFSQLLETTKEAIQSGWAQTWEFIFGDFNQAKELWTGVNDVLGGIIAKQSKARNDLLKSFNEMGGRSNVIKGLSNIFNELGKVITSIGSAFREIFKPMTAKRLIAITKSFKDMSKNFKISDKTLGNLKDTFKGFFSLINLAKSGILAVAGIIKALIPDNLINIVLQLTGGIGKFVTALNETITGSKNFQNGLKNMEEGISNFSNGIGLGVETAVTFIGNLFSGIQQVFSGIWSLIGPLVDDITKAVSKLSSDDLVNGGIFLLLGAGASKVMKFDGVGGIFKSLLDPFKTLNSTVGTIKETFESLTDIINAFAMNIKANALLKIAIALGIVAASIKLLSTIPTKELATSFGILVLSMMGLIKGYTYISGYAPKALKSMVSTVGLLLGLATAIGMLAISLKLLSTIKPKEMATALAGLAGSMIILSLGVKALSKSGKLMAKTSASLILLSGAMVVLSVAIKNLSKIKQDDMIKALISLGVILGEIAIFMKVIDKLDLSLKSMVGLIALGSAINIIVSALKGIATIKTGDLIKAMATLTVIFFELEYFSVIASKNTSAILTTGIGLIALSTSINILVPSLEKLGNMKVENIIKSLTTLAITLTIFANASTFIKPKQAMALGVALGVLGAGFMMLAPALKIFGNMKIKEMVKSLTMLAGVLVLVGIGAKVLGPSSLALLAFGASIALVGLGIAALVASLTALAAVTTTTVKAFVDNLLTLATEIASAAPQFVKAAFDIITALAKGLAENAGELIGSAVAVVLQLMTAIKDNAIKFADIGVDMLKNLMIGLGRGLPGLLEAGVTLFVEFLNGMADAVRNNAGKIVDAFKNLIESLLEVVIEGVQAILEGLFGWIPGASDKFDSMGEDAKEALRDAFGINDGSAEDIGETFGSKVGDGIGNTDLTEDTKKLVENAAKGTEDTEGLAEANGILFGGSYGGGIAGSTNNVKQDALNLLATGKKYSKGSAYSEGNQMGNTYSNGINGAVKGAILAAGKLPTNAKKGAKGSGKPQGEDFGQGYANGITNKIAVVADAASSLAIAAALAVAKKQESSSPSKVTKQLGLFFGDGYELGISNKKKDIVNTASSLALSATTALNTQNDKISFGDKLLESFNNTKNSINSSINDIINLNPVIKPVLDLSNLNMDIFNSKLQLAIPSGVYIPNTVGTNSEGDINIGDINITVNVPENMDETNVVDLIKDQVGEELTKIVKSLRKVR